VDALGLDTVSTGWQDKRWTDGIFHEVEEKEKKKRRGSVGLRFPTLSCLGLGLVLPSAFAFLTLKNILEIHRMGGDEFDPLA